jgi:hypothetical protein
MAILPTREEMPEPADRSIVAWFDTNDDLYWVLQRNDDSSEAIGEDRWFPPYDSDEEDPIDWEQACDEHDNLGLRGPVLLVPQGSDLR